MNSLDRQAFFGQNRDPVRFDWGPTGAQSMEADLAVVVDVLSFSTSVCVAVERGMRVFPYRWKGPGAEAFARDHDAVLAVGRLESTLPDSPTALSLSPAALLTEPSVARLVLPSPNGAMITTILAESGAQVIVGCLRNSAAVAEVIAARLGHGESVAIIAAGERWRGDDSLRPSLEDHLGVASSVNVSRVVPAIADGAFRPSVDDVVSDG